MTPFATTTMRNSEPNPTIKIIIKKPKFSPKNSHWNKIYTKYEGKRSLHRNTHTQIHERIQILRHLTYIVLTCSASHTHTLSFIHIQAHTIHPFCYPRICDITRFIYTLNTFWLFRTQNHQSSTPCVRKRRMAIYV